MTPALFATMAMASSGVYIIAAANFGGLWWLRRESEEHGFFALYCLALTGFAWTSGLAFEAHDVAALSRVQPFLLTFVCLACAGSTSFCECLVDARTTWLRRTAWGAALLSVVVFGSGLGLDPGQPDPAWNGCTPARGGWPHPLFLPAGWLCLLQGLGLYAVSIVRLAWAARVDPSLRSTAAAITLPLLAGLADGVAYQFGSGPSVGSRITPLLSVVAVTWTLLGRISRMETDLGARTEELTESYASLRRARSELVRREQLAAVGELSTVIAHEVRNPLAIIRNAVSMLRKPGLAARDSDEMLGVLDQESNRLNRLVQDLLAYTGPGALVPVQVSVEHVVREAAARARDGHPRGSDFELRIDCADGVATIAGDPVLLRHAVINLVENAIQAMRPGGTLRIECRTATLEGAPAVAIQFHDDGEGMNAEVRDRARTPFFTTRATGTGLGLAIVERVVRLHGGTVEFESGAGRGTTVTLLIPRERISAPPPSGPLTGTGRTASSPPR